MSRDWEAHYRAGDMPWDKGHGHPALELWLSKNRLAGKILVPGCGSGHDVRILSADPDAFVTGLDIAPGAKSVADAHAKAGNEVYVTADFLSGAAVPEGVFDAVFEHTLFCAILPSLRYDYEKAVAKALHPGGLFLAVFYCDPSHGGGTEPPFGCSMEEIGNLFGNDFEVLSEEVAHPTFEGRDGRETLCLMRRKNH